ncbi:hypothetical protein CAPTEDRAFT_227353 [Capitella teleta]|uniref:DUF7869 domain-containing protein n=1 Tax=Capitella teleta TaxID=283909 RepID=R7UKQ6_CAPTE|nr:hypothetical protein CAPTEDRAFT_227353 [Capitella teleta]|eukprot:ELU07094.1 hypothetical protein CAPTEDRAFT_227353 [Capitella teleta]
MDASHADIARLLNSTENDRLKGLDMLLLYNEKDGDDGDHATASLSDPDSPPPSDDEDEVTTQRACAIGIDEVVAGKENVEVDDLLNEAGKFSCKCKHFPGKEPCSNYFSADEFATSRMNMASIPFPWRVATGLHKTIHLHFMVAGHTKFAPDWCFGLLKQAFRRSKVATIQCMEKVVNGSADCNVAQPVGLEDGTVFVPMYNWQAMLSPFGKHLKGIKEQAHFTFSSENPGRVLYSATLNGPKAEWKLFAAPNNLPTELPEPIQPPGLPRKRREYLHHSIRQFADEEHQDTAYPHPDVISPVFAAAEEDAPSRAPPPPEPCSPPPPEPCATRKRKRKPSVKKTRK